MSRSTGWALAGLLGYMLLFFAPAALGGGQFFFRDVSQNHYPMRAFAEEELKEGSLPSWNPHLTFGQPAAANPNYMVLHPTSVLFRVLPFDAAFRWSILLQFLLAAWGMFLLARDLGCSGSGSSAAALAFAFSGPMASLGNLYNVLGTAAWLPLAVFLMRRAVSSGGPGWILGAAAALAVEVVGGEPLVILGTLALGLPLAWQARPTMDPVRAAGRFGGVLVGGVLLGAVQVLPTLALLPWTERGAGFDPDLATKWSTHPFRLLELVVPGLFGDPTSMAPGTWWGEGFFESTLPLLLGIYVGAPVLLLAAAGATEARRHATARLLLLGTGLSLLLALGKHAFLFRGLQALVPGLDSVRYPSKLLLITAFCLAALAGMGIDALSRKAKFPRSLAALGGALAIGGGGAALAILWARGFGGRVLHGPMRALGDAGGARDAQVLPDLAASLGHGAGMALLTLVLCALLVRRPAARIPPAVLLVCLIGVDLLAVNGPLNPTVHPEWYRAKPRFLDTIRDIDPGGRIYRFSRPSGFGVRIRDGAGAASTGFLWDRLSFRNATGLQYGLSLAWDRNNERLHPESSAAIARGLEELPLQQQVDLWRLGSTRYVVSYRTLEHPGLRPLDAVRGESSHPLLLYEVLDTLPRARMISRPTPRESLTSPADAFEATGGMGAGPAGEATIVEETGGLVRIRTQAAAEGFLVLSDTFFPGWAAEVDGRPTAIAAAYGLFREVPVPAGSHEVIFRYRPPAFRAGLLLALAGLVLPLGLSVWMRRRGVAS